MPLPGFKMAKKGKAAAVTTMMTKGVDDEARPKRGRRPPSWCKHSDGDQGSSPCSGKRPKRESDDKDDKVRAGAQSNSDGEEGSRDPEDDVGANGLNHAIGKNGDQETDQNKNNSSASADRKREVSVEAGRSSPARVRSGGGGGGGGASCPTSNSDIAPSASTSTAVMTGTRDKPTTGLLRSLMIGPAQDRGSTMEFYRPSLLSSSSFSSSSSSALQPRRKKDPASSGNSNSVAAAPSKGSDIAATVADCAAMGLSEGSEPERISERWQPSRTSSASGGLRGGTSNGGSRGRGSGGEGAEDRAQLVTYARAPIIAPPEGRRDESTNETTHEGSPRQDSFGEDARGWGRSKNSIESSPPGLAGRSSGGRGKGATKEGYRGVGFGCEDAEGREKTDRLHDGNSGSAMEMTEVIVKEARVTEGNGVEHHLIRQFQGWDGYRQVQLNMRQEEHQVTRWRQQHLQEQKLLEQQLEMLRTSHLQLRRQQQQGGQGAESSDACREPSGRSVPSSRPPLLPLAPPSQHQQDKEELEHRRQARLTAAFADHGRNLPREDAPHRQYSGEDIINPVAHPSVAPDGLALAARTMAGSDPMVDRFSNPKRSLIPFPIARGNSEVQQPKQQKEQHQPYVEHQRHFYRRLAASESVDIGYTPSPQGEEQPFRTSQDLHRDQPIRESGRAPHLPSMESAAVRGGPSAGAGNFGGDTYGNGGGSSGSRRDADDHTNTTLALVSVKSQLDHAMSALHSVYAKAGEEVARNRRVIEGLQNEIETTRSELAVAKTASDADVSKVSRVAQNPIAYPERTGSASAVGGASSFATSQQTSPGGAKASLDRSVGHTATSPSISISSTEVSRTEEMADGATIPLPPLIVTEAGPAEATLRSPDLPRAEMATVEQGDEAVIRSREVVSREGHELSQRPRRGSPTTMDSGSGGGRTHRLVTPSAAPSAINAMVSPRDTVPPTDDQSPSSPALGEARPGYVGDCISSGSSSDTADFAESPPPPRAIPGSPTADAAAAQSPIASTITSLGEVAGVSLDAPPSERPPISVGGRKGRRRSHGRSSWGSGAGLELIVEASTKLSELENGYNRQQEDARALEIERRRSNDLEVNLGRARNSLRDSDIALKDRDQTISRLSVEVVQSSEEAEGMRGQLASLKAAMEKMQEQLAVKDVEVQRLTNEIAQQRHTPIPDVGPAALSVFSSGVYGSNGGGFATSVARGGLPPDGRLPTDILRLSNTQHHPPRQQDHLSRQQQPTLPSPRRLQHPHQQHPLELQLHLRHQQYEHEQQQHQQQEQMYRLQHGFFHSATTPRTA